MKPPTLQVLYEDNHLLALAKPAGLPTVGVAEHEPSVAKLGKEYLRQKYQKPGNVFLGVMSRLDSLVTGVVLLARTSKAAARLTEQFRERTVEKDYLTVVEGTVPAEAGTLEDWVAKNDARHRMEVVAEETPTAQFARLEYRRLTANRDQSLLAVRLETGRKHQIRLQFANRGQAVLGDVKYGSSQRFGAGIALHAARLSVRHPTRDELITITCPLPKAWISHPFGGVAQGWLEKNGGK